MENVNKATYLQVIFRLYKHLRTVPTWEQSKKDQLLMRFRFKTLNKVHLLYTLL